MKARQNISSGTFWEKSVGYSRVVRIGNFIYVAGTTAIDEQGNVIGVGDVYAQTAYILKKIEKTLYEAGASIEHVVRTRSFIVDINRWQEFGKAHGEYFTEIRPVSTLVEVNRLIMPELLIEIEADAVILEKRFNASSI
jgi:enamine deaminase RidA (YjgF/YER057c/UK114 family)